MPLSSASALKALAPGPSLVRRTRIMEHRAGPGAHTHPCVAATYRRADAGSSAAGDPAALIDTNAHADRAHACADTHIHATTADTDAQRHTGEDRHTDAHSSAHGGTSDKARRSATDSKESDREGGSRRELDHAYQSRR